MSGYCAECGEYSRHPCSESDSERAVAREVLNCGNANKWARRSALETLGFPTGELDELEEYRRKYGPLPSN